MKANKVESVSIRKLVLEDETGARVVIAMPRGALLQEGALLRNISLGALSTTAIINDFKKARLKAADLKGKGVEGLTEIVHGDSPEKLRPIDPVAQAQAALEGAEVPPVFVAKGDEKEYCTCKQPMGTRRCFNCGFLINRA